MRMQQILSLNHCSPSDHGDRNYHRKYQKALRPSGKNESQIRYVSYLDLRVASTATPRRPTTTTPVIAGRV